MPTDFMRCALLHPTSRAFEQGMRCDMELAIRAVLRNTFSEIWFAAIVENPFEVFPSIQGVVVGKVKYFFMGVHYFAVY